MADAIVEQGGMDGQGTQGRGAMGALRLLVAEDNATGRCVLTSLLETLGHTCHVVDDGQAALDALDGFRPDLVVMNLGMPRRDGLSAIRAIRASGRPWSTIPIAALTADGSPATAEAALAAGADAIIHRPVHRHSLSEALEAARAARRPAGQEADGAAAHHVEALRALESEIGKETVAMLLRVLVEDSTVRFAAMRDSLHDAEGVAREAHALKSAFGTFGLDGPARLARDIEANAASLDPSMLDIAIRALEDDFSRLVAELRIARPSEDAA